MSRRVGALMTMVLAAVAVFAAGTWRGEAQVAPAEPTTTVTLPPTTEPPAPTTIPPTTTPPTTIPPVVGPAPSTPAVPPPPAPNEPAPDTGPVAAPPDPGTPHGARPRSNYIPTGSNSSKALVDALKALENLGFTPEEAFRTGMGHFPVAGYATYSDDWHAPRGTPEAPRLHMGTDIFAAFDTPVRAPFDGSVRFNDSGLGGKAATLTTSDGTYYYMAHLSGFAPDVPNGSSVRQGQIIGFNGDSGNAAGGSPHVHFEIHPGGGAAVNPKPVLDQWLAEALAAASGVIASYQVPEEGGTGSVSSLVNAMGQVRRFDGRRFAGQSSPQMAPLLWASSVSPTGSALRLAEVQAARAVQVVDWEALAREERARASVRRNVLTPLTPAPFAEILVLGRD